ncbi:MAG: hypothetical protein RL365_2197 [Bacteroidota bacterium]|jgi:hypothetical protein
MNQQLFPNETIYCAKEYTTRYLTCLKTLSDKELASAFNQKVGIRYFNFAIQGFMKALIHEMQKRDIDFSAIKTSTGISWANNILIEDRVVKIQYAALSRTEN